MGLLSIFKRDRADASASSAAAQTVQQARTRARRRLMGATLLVLMGIVGFPLLFESQPRPIPVDIPIEIPRPESAAPLNIPPARSQVIVVEPSVAVSPAPKPAPAELARTDELRSPPLTAATVASAAKPPAPARADVGAADRAQPRVVPPAPAVAPKSAASEPRETSRSSASDSARAQALLEGRESRTPNNAAATNGRFVVQVGAFSDAAAAKEVRQKVEKLGLKTYTQVVDTSSGSRTRVRVGPMESKDQADKVLERLKAAGLSAVVLTL